MIVSELSTQVNDLLRPMGITRNLSAYSILCQCLELVCEQEDRLQAVEKDIYTPIADRRKCEPKAIQSAVRRAAKGAWLTNPEYVQQLAGYPLTGAPSPLGISSQVIYGLAAIAIWRDMGYCMLIYIAALQSISLEYYEAARVEGANVFHEFIHITLPMIVPAITSNVTLLLSWGLRCFDYSQMVINMKTAKTTAVFVYEYIFGNSRAGLGQAGAIILTLVLVILTNLVTTILRKKEVEL